MTNDTVFLLVLLASLIFFTMGFLIGNTLEKAEHNKRKRRGGTFHINMFDPNKDVISIELEMLIAELIREKEVYFKIEVDEEELKD